jgi:hypothetical protein
MALPMLLNTGTSVVGSIFGKKSAKKPAQSVNQPGPQTYRPAPPPSWMNDGPRRRRRRSVNMAPLRYGWKTKAVYLNNQLITPQSSKENELQYIHDLMTTVPSDFKDGKDINLMIRDTPGEFDTIVNLHDGGAGCDNLGARARYLKLCRALEFECIEDIDLLGHNKRYVPTSFDVKVVLMRLEKNKMLLGTAAQCALVDLRYTDFELQIPILKPNAQLSAAINELMIQKGEECRFYRITHRYVAFPIAVGQRHIQHKDIFNGARPGRLITKVVGQDRYNGAHTLNPFSIPFPEITRFAVSINEAEIPPVYHSSKESYVNLRQILDRRHSEMPFTYAQYVSDYGIIVTDLSPNRDGFSQVLPNATSGNVGIKLDFTADTQVAQQLICVGEFRNQLSVGYGTQARLKDDI